MSFIGAVCSSVRQAIGQYSGSVTSPVHLVGAGNFTVASVLRSGGYTGQISACDVSLYTSVLGAYLSDGAIELSEKQDCPDHLKGLIRPGSMVELTASIALLYDLRDVWQLKNPYQQRAVDQYLIKWNELIEKTVSKLEAYKNHIGEIDYYPKDGFLYLEEQDRASTVFVFPPTYKNGYERLEKLLHATIEWQPPEYTVMTDKDLSLYEQVAGYQSYFVVLEKNLPEVHAIIGKPSAILPRGRAAFSHIIVKNPSKKKIVLHNDSKSSSVGPFWPSNKKITGMEKLSLKKISLAQSIRMNELFLSKRIDYFAGGVGVSLAFMLDGLVFGKADFAPSSHRWKLPDDSPMIYLMSDLAVPSSAENRLAKLVLLALLSREVNEAINLKYIEDFKWACTTAFTLHPVSMKYRGIFKKHKRKEVAGGYLLNYYAPFATAGLSQVLEIWQKKYLKKG